MNKTALRARNYRLGIQHPANARLSPEGGRREAMHIALPLLQSSILREQSHRYHDKLMLANKVSRTLAEADSPGDLYQRLAGSIFYLLPRVHFLYLFQFEPLTAQIRCMYAAQESASQPQAFDPAVRISPLSNELLKGVVRFERPLVINDFSQRMGLGGRSGSMPAIQSALATPMILQGEAQGVLELLSKVRHRFGTIETDLISLVSGSAAAALDNLRLRKDLASSTQQLGHAYDAAVEAWRRALELRDQATENHGCRVAEMTVRLGVLLGYGSSDLTHLKFGAQLHDIGKIGVPDSVLLKPGPLDEQDKKIMRKHPVYAYEMLSSIPNFEPILDIPYYHHERWDGGGYPTGLRGEQIPLSARIFAVIDVWDALRSDRPYRSAWPEKEVITYIRDQSGKHFDPKIVDVFLRMMMNPVYEVDPSDRRFNEVLVS
jgi:HD-GYP domain-containing protein (c-di-GMP phosphodiesterase class II)